MNNEEAQFVGREHFIAQGRLENTERLAGNTFYILVGRAVFSEDTRLPNLSNIGPGLSIVRREETPLGELPEWAMHARNAAGTATAATARCENYAIGALSLAKMTDFLEADPIYRPSRLSVRGIDVCKSVCKAVL